MLGKGAWVYNRAAFVRQGSGGNSPAFVSRGRYVFVKDGVAQGVTPPLSVACAASGTTSSMP